MKKDGFSLKKRYMLSGFLVLVIILALLTNPTKEEYMDFSHSRGALLSINDKAGNSRIKIDRVNFYIFSTYTPFIYVEPGITHLGVFGHFIQISDGQFDYPRWLELFDKSSSKQASKLETINSKDVELVNRVGGVPGSKWKVLFPSEDYSTIEKIVSLVNSAGKTGFNENDYGSGKAIGYPISVEIKLKNNINLKISPLLKITSETLENGGMKTTAIPYKDRVGLHIENGGKKTSYTLYSEHLADYVLKEAGQDMPSLRGTIDLLPDEYKWDLAVKNGDVVEVGGKTYNFEKLEGFIKAFKGNKAFESDMIRITTYTKEGDALINILTSSSEGVKLITDNTRDKWSSAERRKRVEHKVVDIIQENIFDGVGDEAITDKGEKIFLFHVSNK